MTQFTDLPIELLPSIVGHLLRPQHLAQVCLVNKSLYHFAISQLYERVSIFAWHRDGKNKAVKLLHTLAEYPHLACYVKRLELREFPKSLPRVGLDELLSTCAQGLKHCINLHSCTWTRDGSLKTPILEALSQCPTLRVLEINGHHNHNYYPENLLRFTRLTKLTVIMPSIEVIQMFPAWLQLNCNTLKTLTLICKSSPIVTDKLLHTLAPTLSQLEHLHLAGCPKVTHQGITDVLSENIHGIEELALEGLSTAFDMSEFRNFSERTNMLNRLYSVTFTVPQSGATSQWLSNVHAVLQNSPLRRFHLYASGSNIPVNDQVSLDDRFVETLVTRHTGTLVRFAVLRIPVSIPSMDFLRRTAHGIEQLFISVKRSDLDSVGMLASQFAKLRTLHISYALGQDEITTGPLPTKEQLLFIAGQLKPTVTQFGVQTRVWQIERVPVRRADGSFDTEVRLGSYESTDIPEVFLVVRT